MLIREYLYITKK